jgi:hypothetical protein
MRIAVNANRRRNISMTLVKLPPSLKHEHGDRHVAEKSIAYAQCEALRNGGTPMAFLTRFNVQLIEA